MSGSALELMQSALNGELKPTAGASVPTNEEPAMPAPNMALDMMQSALKGELKPTDPVASKAPSLAHSIGAGMIDAASGVANVMTDPFGNLIGKPLASAIQFGHDALAPVFGYQRFPEDVRNMLTGDVVPQPGTRAVNAIDNAVTGGVYQNTAPSAARALTAGAGMGAMLAPAGVAPGMGAVIGAGGSLAAEKGAPYLPGWVQPFGAQVLGAIGGIGAGGGAAAARSLVREGVTQPLGRMGIGRTAAEVETAAAPHVAEGATGILRPTIAQLDQIARDLRQAAGQSGAKGVRQFQDALANNPRELVPGAQPTTAQVAPLPGIVKFEDTARAQNGTPFITRDQTQQVALLDWLRKAAPENANPAAVGDRFRSIYNDLEAQVRTAVQPLAETGRPGSVGEAARNVVETARVENAKRMNQIYGAIDPENKLSLPVVSGREAAVKITGEIAPELASFVPPQIRTMLDVVQSAPDVLPLQRVRDYMSQIGDLQRAFGREQGWDSQPVRQLTILKQGLAEDIRLAAERVAQMDEQAVAAGTKRHDQTIMARFNNLEAPNAGPITGGPDRRVPETAAAVDAVNGAGNGGISGEASRGPGNAASDRPVAVEAATGGQPGLTPNFPPEAAAQLEAANAQYRQHKETYRQGPVGDILKSGRGGQQFGMAGNEVAANLVKPETLRAYLAAAPNAEQAAEAASNAMIWHLHQNKVIGSDGIVNPTKLAAWRETMRHSLDQLPEFANKIKTVQEAQEMLDRLGIDRSQQIQTNQIGKLRVLMNEEPNVAIPRILNGQDRVKLMGEVARAVESDPEAKAGLQRAVVDYMIDKYTSAPKTSMENAATPGTSGPQNFHQSRIRDFVDENKPWMIKVFDGGQGMTHIENVMNHLQRQQMVGLATKGSQTVERGLATKIGGHGMAQTVMALMGEKLMESLAAGTGTHGVGAYAMEAAGLAAPLLIHAMRQRGITTMNALRAEAALNPEFAKLVMQRTQGDKINTVMQRRIAAALLNAPQTGDRKQ